MKPEQCLLELPVAKDTRGLDTKSCNCCCHCNTYVKVEADQDGHQQQSEPTAEKVDCFVGAYVSTVSGISESEFAKKFHTDKGLDVFPMTKQHLESKPSSGKNFLLNGGRIKEERTSSTSDMVIDFAVKTEDDDVSRD